MKNCECDTPGYCEFFKKEMGENPPHWKWCQNANEGERIHYKTVCDLYNKNFRINPLMSQDGLVSFVTINDLIEDCKNHLIPKLGGLKLEGVAGVPRSGLLPASICALSLNIPLYSFNSSGDLYPLSAGSQFGGQRMKDYEQGEGKILVLDDTVYSGRSINEVKEILKKNKQILYGSLYVHPKSLREINIYGKELTAPHLLEWSFFNSGYIKNAVLDFDGILSPNVPYEICQNETDYIDYITNVEPLYHRLPQTYTCKGIATARLEKYRDITEAWLEKYNVKYGFLYMFPTEEEKARNSNHIFEAAEFKSKIFMESNAAYFVESEPAEAELIKKRCHKPVICPDEGNTTSRSL